MKRVGLEALSENLSHIMSLAKTSLLNLLSIAEEEVCPFVFVEKLEKWIFIQFEFNLLGVRQLSSSI